MPTLISSVLGLCIGSLSTDEIGYRCQFQPCRTTVWTGQKLPANIKKWPLEQACSDAVVIMNRLWGIWAETCMNSGWYQFRLTRNTGSKLCKPSIIGLRINFASCWVYKRNPSGKTIYEFVHLSIIAASFGPGHEYGLEIWWLPRIQSSSNSIPEQYG